jgi:hypothetical protein
MHVKRAVSELGHQLSSCSITEEILCELHMYPRSWRPENTLLRLRHKSRFVNAVFMGNRFDCRRQYANAVSVLSVRRLGGTHNVALRIVHFPFRVL